MPYVWHTAWPPGAADGCLFGLFMTPVHKKRVLMRLIFLSLGAFAENDRIAF
jgi:hypothetical protein